MSQVEVGVHLQLGHLDGDDDDGNGDDGGDDENYSDECRFRLSLMR